MTDPFAFHLHLVAWLVIVATAVAYAPVVRRWSATSGPGPAPGPSARQWWFLCGGLVALALALTWPVADLAAHWSLTALIVQRLLLTLAAAPLLLLALPSGLLAAMTRPAPVDRALEVLTRPPVAVVVFTVIAVGTLLTPAVAAQASSGTVRAAFDVVLLVGGAVLWGPVLGHIPGASRPSPVALAVYLFVQSVVPGFPSVIYVFSHHPFYGVFAHAHSAIGLSALADQQVAGILAKVATLPVLWTTAWFALTRAATEDAKGADTTVLTWAEVQRHLERAERAETRGPRRHPRHVTPIPRLALPPRMDATPPMDGPVPMDRPRPSEPPMSERPGDPTGP